MWKNKMKISASKFRTFFNFLFSFLIFGHNFNAHFFCWMNWCDTRARTRKKNRREKEDTKLSTCRPFFRFIMCFYWATASKNLLRVFFLLFLQFSPSLFHIPCHHNRAKAKSLHAWCNAMMPWPKCDSINLATCQIVK